MAASAAVTACALLPAGGASAATLSVRAERPHGSRVLVFDLKRVDTAGLRRAYLKLGRHRRSVAVRRVRRASRRGVLRLRLTRRERRLLRRARRRERRLRPTLVLRTRERRVVPGDALRGAGGPTPTPTPTPAPPAPTPGPPPPPSGELPGVFLDAWPNPALPGEEVVFSGLAADEPPGLVVRFQWDLDGDGTFETDTGRNGVASRSYPSVGTRTVRLRVTAADGSTAEDAVSAVVHASTPAAGGDTYYLDPGGDDRRSGRSPTDAWRSLGRATAHTFGPGDRLLLRRGSSWTGTLAISESGTRASPIALGAYGTGELPRITGGDCLQLHGSHVVVNDLHIDNCTWAGIEVYGAENLVERNLVTRNIAGIFVRPGAISNRLLRNTVRDNNRMSIVTPDPSVDDSGAFGVLLQGDRTDVAYNTISGSDAFSIKYERDGAAVEIYGGRANRIRHNLAIDNHSFSELGNPRSADNTYAYNVFRSNLEGSIYFVTRGSGIPIGPIKGTRLYGNTVYATGAKSQGVICHAGCGPDILEMRNNVVQAVKVVAQTDRPFDEDHNLFFGGPLFLSPGPNSVVADPRFVDPGAGDLQLRPSSPAVDAGTGLPYTRDADGAPVPRDGDGDGTAAFDLGALELQP